MEAPFAFLPRVGEYRTIVADPPWAQPTGGRGSGSTFMPNVPSQLPYSTMSLDEIKALPVRSLSAKDAHLYLWTTNAFLEHSFSVARAWGFAPTTTLTWVKNPIGLGLGGAFATTTEYVLFCRRGSLKALSRSRTCWFNWKRQYDRRGKTGHSTKPDAFLDLVEQISPEPRIELFARRRRLGWDAWGNEVDSDLEIAS